MARPIRGCHTFICSTKCWAVSPTTPWRTSVKLFPVSIVWNNKPSVVCILQLKRSYLPMKFRSDDRLVIWSFFFPFRLSSSTWHRRYDGVDQHKNRIRRGKYQNGIRLLQGERTTGGYHSNVWRSNADGRHAGAACIAKVERLRKQYQRA